MALTFNGTIVLIDSKKLPAGYSKPVIIAFSDSEWKTQRAEIQVNKSLIENVSELTTFTNLMDDPINGLNKKIEDRITAEFDTVGNTVDAFAQLINVKSNQLLGDDLYNNTVTLYRCAVQIFVKLA